MKINYFTLKEVLDLYPTYAPTPNATNETNWFLSMLSSASLTLRYAGIKFNGTTIKEADTKKYIDELMNVVFDRYHENYIYRTEKDEIDTSDFPKAVNKLINVMNLTLPKYLPLIYNAEKLYEDALKQLESETSSFTRFNDTPEDEQDEVDYNTPSYASNMGHSKSNSKIDSGTPVDRMEALRTKWKSIILEWSNEFGMIFIDEYQLEGF
ncbi:MAG: hypothetical protein J6S67_01720 [Methanobrevibacter sp.]|nr:hypothetical protein [Methanobrevibacter sp.]